MSYDPTNFGDGWNGSTRSQDLPEFSQAKYGAEAREKHKAELSASSWAAFNKRTASQGLSPSFGMSGSGGSSWTVLGMLALILFGFYEMSSSYNENMKRQQQQQVIDDMHAGEERLKMRQQMTYATAQDNSDVRMLCEDAARARHIPVSASWLKFVDACQCRHQIGDEIKVWCNRYHRS